MEKRKSFFNNLHNERIDYIFQFLWEISRDLEKTSRIYGKKFKRFY